MAQRENRIPVMMTVTIGAGNFMFEGMVSNISRNGFMVKDVPMRFNPKEKNISAVINCRQGVFKMKVRSTWLKVSGATQSVGFEIMGYAADWSKLLNIFDPIDRGPAATWVDEL